MSNERETLRWWQAYLARATHVPFRQDFIDFPLVPEVGPAPKPSAVNSVVRFNDSTSVSHAHIETL